jgi:hypothetical protein
MGSSYRHPAEPASFSNAEKQNGGLLGRRSLREGWSITA